MAVVLLTFALLNGAAAGRAAKRGEWGWAGLGAVAALSSLVVAVLHLLEAI